MHQRLGSILFIAALWPAAYPSAAVAQNRAGFWISGGVGAISVGGSIDSAQMDRGGGFNIPLSLGWTLNRQMLVGVELDGYGVTFYEPGGDVDTVGTDFLVALTYYPHQSSGFFVKGGIGPAFLDNVNPNPPDPDVRGAGFAVMGGAGYDLYLGRNFSLTSAVELTYGDNGTIEFNDGAHFRDLTHSVVGAWVGFKLN